MTTNEDVARSVDAVIRELDGVAAVFAAAPLPYRAVGALAVDAPLAHVRTHEGALEVTVSVGVAGDDGAGHAEAIAAAVRGILPPEARVRVRVSRIAAS